MVTRTPRADALVSKEVVGARLRVMRKQKGFTLKRLSQVSGVPLSTLSKIELGQASLSYDKLMVISQALSIDMSVLVKAKPLADSSPNLPATVVTAQLTDHEAYTTENYSHKFLFSDIQGKAMTPIISTLHSRNVDDFGDFIRHPGQEFAMVLSGAVKIVFENGAVIHLKRHEAAYFDSSQGHVYLSAGKRPAEVLAVCTNLPE